MATILIVDDSLVNLRLLRGVLESQGHSVLQAESGAEALETLATAAPALVICDIQMPDINGLELARRLRVLPRGRELPLLAVTALAMKGDREEVLAAGFNAYLTKPYRMREIISQVNELLTAGGAHG